MAKEGTQIMKRGKPAKKAPVKKAGTANAETSTEASIVTKTSTFYHNTHSSYSKD